MTSFILLLVSKDQTAETAFARFSAAMKAMPSFEVKSTYVVKGRGEVKGDFILDGNKRLWYRGTASNGVGYTISITPNGYRELNVDTKLYDERPYTGSAQVQHSRISPLDITIPTWLAIKSLTHIFPKSATVKSAGTETLDGNLCNKIVVDYKGQMGSGHFEFSIAQSGLVYYYHSIVDSPEGHSDIARTLSSYKPLHSPSAIFFEAPIPDRYMPFSVPDQTIPAEVGQKTNLSGWVDSRSGRPWAAKSGKPVLFVLTGADSMPSKKAISALGQWRGDLKGVDVEIASDEPTRSAAKGLLFNPDQKSVKALDAPAYPMFYLLDSNGVVRNLWMGYAAKDGDKMRSELTTAIRALK